MKTLVPVSFIALLLAGCGSSAIHTAAPGPEAQATGLAPQAARITDERILADRKTMQALQDRLRKLNEQGVPQNNYSLAKAQCWLNTAETQYQENDRTGYVEESLLESSKIIQALEANKGAAAGYDTPLVAHSTRLRDDLWGKFSDYKRQPTTLACNGRTVACGEIDLVRAGHAEQQTGWRAATPHVEMAEDAIRRAGQEAAACQPAVQPAQPAPPPPAPVVQKPTEETFVLTADTLFKFDKSGPNDLLPGGRENIARVAERLKAYKIIQNLTVNGYTDRLGSDSYNDALSARRAQTVLSMLQSMGVNAQKTAAIGRGKHDPVTNGCPGMPLQQTIGCLQSDRRVSIHVEGIAK